MCFSRVSIEARSADPVAERLRLLKENQKEAKIRANTLRKEIMQTKKAIRKTKGMTSEDLFAAARRAEASEVAAAAPG